MATAVLLVNSEGFLAEVFHPWVRWEGPGSGFENSSGGGVWAQAGPTWVGPSWAQVGGPKPGPSGWAQVGGPTWLGPSQWVGLGYMRSKNKVFERPG